MRLRVWLSLLVIFACAAAGAAPDTGGDLPDAKTLQARVEALADAAPPNFRETITAHDDDGDTGFVTYHLFDDSRTVVGSGPLERQYGTFQHQDWTHDENGVTAERDYPPDEPHMLTVARAGTTYVLSNLTKNGYGTRTYVDATTLREQRVDEIDAISTTTTTYTSFGTFGGYTMPVAWTVATTTAGKTTTATYARKDVVLGTVTADQVAVPPTSDIVTFPAGEKRVELPTTFANGSSVVLLHANIGGQSALFQLDSGASLITISPGLAHRIGAKIVDTGKLAGSGVVSAKEAVIPVLQIGPLTMHDVVAAIVPVGSYGFNNEEFGLIGFDFLATLAVTIDYLHQHVYAESGWDYRPPTDRSTFPLPLRLDGGIPMTNASINGANADRLVVDTGAGATLMLFHYFSRQHPEIFDQPDAPDYQQAQFIGVGGGFLTEAFYFRAIKLGHLKLENFNGYRTTADSQAFNWAADGLFGADFLRHFTVIFDYVHAQMFLQQNHDGGLLPVGR